MLVLTRKPGERTVIDDRIEVVILEVKGDRVILGFEAERTIPIRRAELASLMDAEPAAAG